MKFYKTDLEKELLIARIKRYPSLLQIFRTKKDVTNQVKEDIQMRVNGEIENFITIFITGNQGSLKSSIGQEIAKEHDPTFNVNRICFTYGEFRDKLEISKPKQWMLLDEQVFQSGIGSGRLIQGIQTLIEILRARQNSLVVISPEKKYFPENIFTYTIETIDRSILGTCKDNNKLHEIRTCQHKAHKNIQATVRSAIKKDMSYIGFYTQPINWNTKLWREYYIRKMIFIKSALKEDFKKLDYQKVAEKTLQEPNIEDYKTSKQLMLLLEQTYPNLAIAEKNLIIEAIKLERKRRG